jgi:hypothetical protein
MRLRRLGLACGSTAALLLPLLAFGPSVGAVSVPVIWAHVADAGPTGSIEGYEWAGDSSVDVSVNGSLVADDHALDNPPAFFLPYQGLKAGDVVTVIGNTTATEKSVTVANQQLTLVDVGADTAVGVVSPAPEWGFSACATMPGNPPCVTPLVDSITGGWVADFSGVFDLQYGSSITLSQPDVDGDLTISDRRIPMPTVQAWDVHGVAADGWASESVVTLSVDDPGDAAPAYAWQVTTDAAGAYWSPMPDGPFNPLQPGWVVSATGDVPVLGGSVTKSLTLPDPIPIPGVSGTVVSDALDGTVSMSTVGAGSRVEVIAFCQGGTPMGTTRGTQLAADVAAFSFDMAEQPLGPVYGFGDICAAPILNLSYRLYDADGDMFQVWWLTEPAPQLGGVPDLVSDGQWIDVFGTGWDLGAVRVAQCELVEGAVGDCDLATGGVVTTSPMEGWPYASAQFGLGMSVQRFIQAGDHEVDCAVPARCAVAAVELYRDGVAAWVPLTLVSLDVEAAAKGTVSTVTGSATVSGTLTASVEVDVFVSGELRQRLGRTRVVVGWFGTWVHVNPADGPTRWQVTVDPQTGAAFGSGKAQLTAYAALGEGDPLDMDVVTVSLSAPKGGRR